MKIGTYLIRAAKYLLLLLVLIAALYLLMYVWNRYPVSLAEYVDTIVASPRFAWMIPAFVVLAAAYPFFGFTRRSMEGSLTADREQILHAFAAYGFEPTEQSDSRMTFRARGTGRRLRYLFEDTIQVRQSGERIEIEGIRSAAVRIAYRLQAYLERK